MGKELEYLEAFGRITLHTEYDNDGSYDCLSFEDDCKLVDNALQRLESIENSTPSEALECLEKLKGMEISSMPFSDEYGTQEVDLNDIRKVGSQLNTDFREYTATIKQALLKAQEPKQYLKWEDLEFEENKHNLKCKMNDSLYYIEWFIDGMGFKTVDIYLDVNKDYLEYCIYLQGDKKQFFNDLHLEKVE